MSIKKFALRFLFYSSLLLLVNFGFGYLFKWNSAKNSELGIFYPSKRWNEFYSIPKESLDISFVGSSLCYRGINPEIVDSITDKKSFNLGSSIQSISTSHYIIEELLEYQKPKVIFLDILPRTLNLESQLESVRYNYEFMNSGKAKSGLYAEGLNFGEKVQFLFPAYYKRDQLNSILKYSLKPMDLSKISDRYYKNGFVTSSKRMSAKTLELKSKNLEKFNWKETERTDSHLDHLQQIIDLCKSYQIELIITISPLPQKFYKNIEQEEFEKLIAKISQENNLKFYNFNKLNLPLNDTLHFKDQHLNGSGAKILSTEIAAIINGL